VSHIRLYSYALSPYAAKVQCYLAYKRLPFETVYVNPLRANEELPLGRTVPVLEIDGEARNESSEIGLWLDERFPGSPQLLPSDGPPRERVLELDGWVTDELIPVVFRLLLAVGEPLGVRLRNRRRGARALDATVAAGIPLALRILYPALISRPAFVRRLIRETDLTRTNQQMVAHVLSGLRDRLGEGPFLGGSPEPTLADLSAYPQLALPYLAGYDHGDAFTRDGTVFAWFLRVGAGLDPQRPLLPLGLVTRPLPTVGPGSGA
jgi:glutathione S-transferase